MMYSQVSFAEKSAVVAAAACTVMIVLVFRALRDVLLSAGMGAFVLKLVCLAVAVIMIESIVHSRLSRSTLESEEGDERDTLIRQRAAASAHTTLLALLVPTMVLYVVLPESWMVRGNATPASIGLQVLLIVMLSELVRHLTCIWLYLRDRA